MLERHWCPNQNTKIGVFPKKLGKPDEFAQMWEAVEEILYLNGEKIQLDSALRIVWHSSIPIGSGFLIVMIDTESTVD